jgi:hypothetical protein
MPGDYNGSESMSFGQWLRHSWNTFRNKDPISQDIGQPHTKYPGVYSPAMVSTMHPDHRRMSPTTDRTLAVSIYNRIAVDASCAVIRHVKTDANGMFREEMKTGLNNVLT